MSGVDCGGDLRIGVQAFCFGKGIDLLWED